MFEQFINQLAWLNHVFQFCSYHNSWLSFITNLFSKRAVLKDNLWTKFWPRRAEQDQPQRDYAQALTDRCSLWLPRTGNWWEVQGRVTQTALNKVTGFSQAHQLLLAPGLPAKGRGQEMWLCSDHEAPEVTEGGWTCTRHRVRPKS